jgi:2-keto-4-pentenoate hydratase
MLSQQQVDQAAQHLIAARKADKPGPCIPESCRPADTDSALAIQDRVLQLLGETIGGWKCGLPNPVTGPIISHIPSSALLHSSPCAVFGGKGQIEPEVAFVMARDLPPRSTPYGDEEIRGAIGEARFVLELITTRFADKASATPAEVLADAFNNHGLVIGPVVPDVFSYDLDKLHAKITTPSGALFDKVQSHPSGNPMNSLRWLVHFLNGRGQGVRAGQIVTTGSYAGIVDAPLNTPIHVELGGFGVLDIELITASR